MYIYTHIYEIYVHVRSRLVSAVITSWRFESIHDLGVFGHFDFQAELAVPVLELRPGARPKASAYALH